ncbi:uncharacterized protein [Melopsittacus undulatus]|uniref:uncharacterized protein isoform X2 n=1 Tax=Melopsittacus undulatus TaxID=13146 RepID=UPI00146C95A7|nr:uncharacterized protein LOC115946652 isoform X2 [Melopsittacus undulatus]
MPQAGGGAARCHAALRDTPTPPRRSAPSGLPLPLCPSLPWGSPLLSLPSVRVPRQPACARRWSASGAAAQPAAGFRSSSGLSAGRGNVCASSSSSCQPGASPGTAAAGRSPPLRQQNSASALVCLFVSLGNFRPCAFRVPAGVTHPPGCRNLEDVKSKETWHISRGTEGPDIPVANQRRDWDVCNQSLLSLRCHY